MNIVALAVPLLKAMGVNIGEETKRELEVIIPQIPAKAIETIQVVGNAIALFDERTKQLEKQNAELMMLLEIQRETQLEHGKQLAQLENVIATLNTRKK